MTTNDNRSGLTRRRFLGTASWGIGASFLGSSFASARGYADPKRTAGSDHRLTSGSSESIRIGRIIPLSGNLVSAYEPLYIAADIARDEINADGGIAGRPIEFVDADDQGSVDQQPAVARQLLDDGVFIIIGPTGASQAFSSLAVTTPREILQFSFVAADEAGDGEEYPFHYQASFNTSVQSEARLRFLTETLGLERIGILNEDSGSGQTDRTFVQSFLRDAGLEPAGDQVYPLDVADLSPLLQQLRDADAQAINFYSSTPNPTVRGVTGLNQLGWQPVLAGANGMLYASPGAGLVDASLVYDDIYATTYRAFTYSDDEPISEEIVAYATQLSERGVTDQALSVAATSPYYDALKLLKHVGDEVGDVSDTAALKAALDGLSGYQGLFGEMSFTADSHVGYGVDAIGVAVVNSSDPPGLDLHGLSHRRAV